MAGHRSAYAGFGGPGGCRTPRHPAPAALDVEGAVMAGTNHMAACIHGHTWPSTWMAEECPCMPDADTSAG